MLEDSVAGERLIFDSVLPDTSSRSLEVWSLRFGATLEIDALAPGNAIKHNETLAKGAFSEAAAHDGRKTAIKTVTRRSQSAATGVLQRSQIEDHPLDGCRTFLSICRH